VLTARKRLFVSALSASAASLPCDPSLAIGYLVSGRMKMV
jgi:hypothetical protein